MHNKRKNINPFKPIKIRKVSFNFDTDRDGVRDKFDCRPFNPWKQDDEYDEIIYGATRKYPGRSDKEMYGHSEEEEQEIKRWVREQEKNIKIRPNASVSEVEKNTEFVDAGVPYYEGQYSMKYQKGDWEYVVGRRGIHAYYLPSMNKKFKLMYKWNDRKGKWELLVHYEGNW